MSRVLALAALAVALAGPAMAVGSQQLRQQVANELESLGFRDVDVDALSSAQLAAIHHLVHEKRDSGGKRGQIRSILGGPDTLRTLLR